MEKLNNKKLITKILILTLIIALMLILIVACNKKVEYKVTFYVDGAEYKTYIVEEGSPLDVIPPVPAKTGKKGVWSVSDIELDEITSNLKVYAIYTDDSYNISFKIDGVVVKTVTLKNGEIFSTTNLPPIPEKEGYVGSWSTTDFSKIRSNFVIEAIYTKIEYKVNFLNEEGALITSQTINDKKIPYVPTCVSIVDLSSKWVYEKDGKLVDFENNNLENRDLIVRPYFFARITFVVDDVIKTQDYDINETINLLGNPDDLSMQLPERYNNLDFYSWYLEQTYINQISLPMTITKNLTLYGRFFGSVETEGLTYEDSLVTGYIGTAAEVYIPYSHREDGTKVRVTGIKDGAFRNNTTIKIVHIPATCVSFGNDAFNGAINLERTVFDYGTNLETIGDNCFYNCNKLEAFEVSNNLTKIGDYAFYNCSSLPIITNIQNSKINTIGSYAFYGCENATNFTIPSTITTIGDYAFYNNKQAMFDINSTNLEYIGEAAFFDCAKLVRIDATRKLTYVGNNAYSGCESITHVSIVNKAMNVFFAGKDRTSSDKFIETIEDGFIPISIVNVNVFLGKGLQPNLPTNFLYNCVNVKNVTVNDGINKINEKAFYSTRNVSSNKFTVNMGNNVTEIGNSAFVGRTDLKEITLPLRLLKIGEYAFSGCFDLFTINYTGSDLTEIGKYAFKDTGYLDSSTKLLKLGYIVVGISPRECEKANITAITSRDIGNSTTIMPFAFEGNTILKTIELGGSVLNIGEGAFKNCSNLETFVFNKNNSLPARRSFGKYILEGCTKLKDITLYEDIPLVNEVENEVIITYGIIDEYPDTINTITYLSSGVKLEVTGLPVSLKAKELVIGEGYTSISKNAFENYLSLEKVTLNSTTLTTINESAFKGCTNLTTLSLTNTTNLTTIGKEAFMDTNIRGNIYLTENLTTIGEKAFYNSDVYSVYCNDNLTSIGDSAFSGCSNLTSFVVNNGIKVIGKFAFKDTGLTKIKLPTTYVSEETIESIDFGEGILYNTKLNTLQLEGTIVISKLFKNEDEIIYPASFSRVEILSGEIIDFAFDGVDTLQEATLQRSVSRIGNFAFRNCVSLSIINIPASVEAIGSGAFKNCIGLANCTIDTSNSKLTQIGNGAFYNCSNLYTVRLPNTITNEEILANNGPGELSSLDDDIDVGLTFSYVFYGCEYLNTVNLPTNITSIGEYAFYDCDRLENITFHDNIEYILDNAFNGCTKIDFDSFTLTKLKAAGDSAFKGCSSLHRVSAINLVSLGQEAYYDCTSIETITLVDGNIHDYINVPTNYNFISVNISGTSIDDLTEYTNIENVTIFNKDFDFDVTKYNETTLVFINTTVYDKFNKNDASRYNFDNNNFIFAFPTKTEFNYTITSEQEKTVEITSIKDNFRNKIYLPSTVSINDSTYTISSIGQNVFKNKDTLEYIYITSSIVSIGDSAFEGCTNLKIVNIATGSNLNTIGVKAFFNCGIESISLPSELITIKESAFANCKQLKTVVFYKDSLLKTVENSAFSNCDGLEKIMFTSAIETIGPSAFTNCSSLSQFSFGDRANIRVIEEYTFLQCSSLEEITLPYTVVDIENDAFASTSLKIVSIPCSVENIYSRAFNSVNTIEHIGFNDGEETSRLKTIGDYAFSNVKRITNLYLPDSLISIGKEAFSGCDDLYMVTLGLNLETIGDGAFKDNINLALAVIYSKYITSNSLNIFSNCAELYVEFSDNVLVVPDNLFKNNTSLKEVHLYMDFPSIMNIGKEAFYGCSKLTSINIPCTVLSIGDRAFAGINNLAINYQQDNKDSERLGNDWYGFGVVNWGADNKTSGEYRYVEYQGNAFITKYLGTSQKDIEIPSTLDGKRVVSFCSTFESNTTLEEVTIPDSITQLGSFYGCTNLYRIYFGKGITSIISNTFANCTSLTAIRIPENITLIDDDAFIGCVNLKLVYFDNGVLPAKIENSNSLGGIIKYADSIYIKKDSDVGNYFNDSETIKVIKNVVNGYDVYTNLYFTFNVNKNAYAYLLSENYDEGIFSLTISGIGETDSYEYALALPWSNYLEDITVVNIDKDITKLGKTILGGLVNLYVVNLGANALSNSTGSNSIIDDETGSNIPFVLNVLENTTVIPSYFMYGANNLGSIIFSNKSKLTSINEYAFFGCTNLKQATLANSIVEIGRSAFFESGLTNVVLGTELKTIGNEAFGEISTLSSVVLKSKAIDNLEDTTRIFNRDNTPLEVTFSLYVDSTVISIPDYLAYGVRHLNSIDFSTANNLQQIGNFAFSRCSIDTLDVPINISTIGEETFKDTKLTSINISNRTNISKIGKDAFAGTNYVLDKNNWYRGLLYLRSESKVYLIAYNKEDFVSYNKTGKLTLEENTYLIAENVFSDANNVTYITIPRGVKYINDNAFVGCTNLYAAFILSSDVVAGINNENDFGGILKYAPTSYVPSAVLNNQTGVTPGSYMTEKYTRVTNTIKFEGLAYDFIIFTELYWDTASLSKDSTYAYLINNYVDNDSSTYRLVFNGEGNMIKNFTNNVPWIDYMQKITSLYVGALVSNIPNNALANANNLKEINISKDLSENKYRLEELGSNAFLNCSSLEQITIVDPIRSIGQFCFAGCTNLQEIDYYAINCNDFTQGSQIFREAGIDTINGIKLTIYSTVKKIPAYLMYAEENHYNYLTKVDFQQYASVATMSFESIGTSAFENCVYLTQFEMRDKAFVVTNIQNRAFYNCKELVDFYIPQYVNSIGSLALANCDKLTNVRLLSKELLEVPEGTKIFANSGSQSRLVLTLPIDGTKVVPNYFMQGANYLKDVVFGVKSGEADTSVCEQIGIGAFEDCVSLEAITIAKYVKYINKGAFAGCTSLKYYSAPFIGSLASEVDTSENTLFGIVFGEKSKEGCIETEQHYSEAGSRRYYIPASLQEVVITYYTNVFYSAFENCNKLTKVTIESNTGLDVVTKANLTINNGSMISTKAFYNCTSLEQITMSEQLLSISENAFENCRSLMQITIPKEVTSIGKNAFYNCINVSALTFNAKSCNDFEVNNSIFSNLGQQQATVKVTIGSEVRAIPNYFMNPELGATNYPNTTELIFDGKTPVITKIGHSAFRFNVKLRLFTIPSSVRSIGQLAFDGTGYYTNKANWTGPILYSQSTSSAIYLLKYDVSKSNLNTDNEVVLNNKTYLIADAAFGPIIPAGADKPQSGSQNNVLTKVTIPESVVYIGNEAFSYCNKLETILFISTSGNLEYIGDKAFYGCSSLGIENNFYITENVKAIGVSAFYGCTSLKQVFINSETILSQLISIDVTCCGGLLAYIDVAYILSTLESRLGGTYISENFNRDGSDNGYLKYTKRNTN